MITLDPTEKCWPKVEANVRIVVYEQLAARFRITDQRVRVGLIALGMNAFVPVVEGCGGRFDLNFTGPRILARWLVEMAMDDERGHVLIRTQAAKRHKRRQGLFVHRAALKGPL